MKLRRFSRLFFAEPDQEIFESTPQMDSASGNKLVSGFFRSLRWNVPRFGREVQASDQSELDRSVVSTLCNFTSQSTLLLLALLSRSEVPLRCADAI
jgi:hypothetical protein